MRTADDAKRDPKPGDVIYRDIKTSLAGCIIREVTRAHGGFVFCFRDNGYTRKNLTPMSVESWRKWAATAEVLKVAQP